MSLLANILKYSVSLLITNISGAVEGDSGDSIGIYVGIGVGVFVCVIIVVVILVIRKR